MVSFPHEALLKLIHDRPGFVADLLTGILGVPIPGLTIDGWLDRALAVASVDELLG